MQYRIAYLPDGTIVGTARILDDVVLQRVPVHPEVAATEVAYEAVTLHMGRFYVDTSATPPALKPALAIGAMVSAATIAADGAAECVIAGLPDPCTVTVAGPGSASWGPHPVESGELTVTATEVGDIKVTVSAPPRFLTFETTVHAT